MTIEKDDQHRVTPVAPPKRDRSGAIAARCAVKFAALLLVLCASALAWGERKQVTRPVSLRGGSIEIQVRFDGGQEAWAAYQLRQAAAYLPAVEAYLGTAFHDAAPGFFNGPVPRALRIEGQEQVLLKGAWIGAYNNSAGLFPGERAIFVEYKLTPMGHPGLLLHELGHYFLYDSAGVTTEEGAKEGASWFNEGAASLMPLAARQAGLFALTTDECAAIGDTWGLRRVPFVDDEPIEKDLRPKGGTQLLLYYEKAFQVHALLRSLLGPVAYRALLGRASRSPAQLETPAGVLSLLSAARPLPFRTLLGGWVFRGAYGPVSPLSFKRAAILADGTIQFEGVPAMERAPTKVR